jgi:eukaryotic-like serine/threonine-protein kinase
MSEKTRARSPVQPGEVIGGKYRVERVLGAGGMGVVVAATHLELGQSVALKFILQEALTGQGAVERFMREARAAVRLKSEHVARVYDVGRDQEDRPYMVLELLEGQDLARVNKTKGPLPVADAVEYVLQACEALVEAHAAGIVHRDLKPQNLFVTRKLNGAPLVKVLDFGIAKAIGPAAVGQMSLTDSQQVIGSPLYMAPEQMRSARTADARTDIWALGVILYELLGGQAPFDGETVTEVCIHVVNDEPKALHALRPGLDQKLVDVVMKCLLKNPDARWQNVAQLAGSLEPFSRSAQQGGPVRPWRSFEDTQDSQERPKLAPAAAMDTADETGPSTAVTMPSAPPPMDAKPGASTNVAWDRSSDRGPTVERPRSFAKGLAAGVVVSIAVVAVAAVVLIRASKTSATNATPASQPAMASSVAAPPPTVAAEPPPTSAPAPTTTTATMTPASLPSASSTAAGVAGRLLRAPRVTKHDSPSASTAATPAAAPSPPTPAATTPKPSDPVAPNGAPILR